jgi:hypothetical protein
MSRAEFVTGYKSCSEASCRLMSSQLNCLQRIDTMANKVRKFYIHGSVHRDSILIRSNEVQQYEGVYLLQNYSTCLGCLSHPSSGIHQTVTAASGTGHNIRGTTFRQRGLIRPRWRTVVALTRDMTCTRGCSYSLMYS